MKTLGMLVAFFALFTWAAWAQNSSNSNSSGTYGNHSKSSEYGNSGAKKQELSNAAQTVQEMTSSNKIPKALLNQAECIAAIPNLTKGALVVGGEHGSGVVSCRNGQGWSAPAFISLSGGSIGLQAGGSSSQIVLLMNKQGEQDLLNGNFKLSAQAVAAGPNGSSYNASTGWKAPILSYKKSNGVYAGADIQGSTIKVDHSAMQDVYGSTTARNVLDGSVHTPQQAQQFVSDLPQGHRMS
jgi:SH3 domain-containing YSC84-like protein 1